MLAKSAVSANSFLLAISTNASTMADDADGLRLVCHVCQLCHVCQVFLADMGHNGQNVVAGAQRGQAQRDATVALREMESSCQRAEGFICTVSGLVASFNSSSYWGGKFGSGRTSLDIGGAKSQRFEECA